MITNGPKLKKSLTKALRKHQYSLVKKGLSSNFSRKTFEGKNGLKVEDFESVYGDINCRITSSLKEYAAELDELIKVSEPLCNK